MKFSIIIPIYNRSFFIDETLSGILNQTYTDIEIICVDDCSTDESLQKIESYAVKDNRIKVISHSKNLGPHCARQTGVSNASGDYILFLDCDDALEVFACSSLHSILSETDYDVLEFAYKHKKAKTVSLPVPFITINNLFDSLVHFKNPRAGTVWNKVYKKELLQKAFSKMQSFYSVMGEDLYESVIIAYYAKSYTFINAPLVLYNDESGISNKKNDLSSVKKSLDSIKANLDAFSFFFNTHAGENTDAVLYIERQYLKYIFYIQILMNTQKKDWRVSLNLLSGCFSEDTLLPYEKKINKTQLSLYLELIKYKINIFLRQLMPYRLKKIIKDLYANFCA
ncbi:glycosyltransferase family 2 protein [Treponema sp. OMZ 792]|uniref:glycosyltransferase family 2 protein n=1 Tax=unclassified Treponema TaxID=2638727 RepID=UPI0020A4E545|nr:MULTISPECIES: glycosyltransferase family A protein [unclassified Treponema]UTC76286.1 glycosyltransferase family 2 protein [Treponema sp. OMZ 792]UTC80287.1 glycosyltransferase family 2 protein [Treponema sp. OMZ 798]